jgi:hypothetical protein
MGTMQLSLMGGVFLSGWMTVAKACWRSRRHDKDHCGGPPKDRATWYNREGLGWNWQQCVVSFFLSPADPYHSLYCIWRTSLLVPKVTFHCFLSALTALIFLRDIEGCLDVSFFFFFVNYFSVTAISWRTRDQLIFSPIKEFHLQFEDNSEGEARM